MCCVWRTHLHSEPQPGFLVTILTAAASASLENIDSRALQNPLLLLLMSGEEWKLSDFNNICIKDRLGLIIAHGKKCTII